MSVERGTADLDRRPSARRVARGFAALALLCGILPLAGWSLGIAWLQTFGIEGRPIWPLTALGYAAGAAGFLALLVRRMRVARTFLAVPLLIVAASLAQSAFGDFGFDRLWFGNRVAAHAVPFAGRPSTSASAIFLLLAFAGLRASRRGLAWDPLVGALGTGAFVLGSVSALLIAFSSSDQPALRLFSSSLPGAIAALSLAAACITANNNPARMRMLSSDRAMWQLLQLLLPIAVLLPLVPVTLAIWLLRGSAPLGNELIVVLFNGAVVAGLAYWAVARVAGEHAALVEITGALESATIAITTLDGRITRWTRGCERLYGWSAAEALGKNKYALLQSRCQHGWSSRPPRPIGSDTQELVELHRDGHEVSVVESVHRVESPGREPLLALGISDISQTVAAMAALKASEERLAIAAGAHELGVFEWDVASGRLEWSPGTEQRLGVVPGSISDFDSWRAQIEPGDLQDILDTIARTVAERADRFTFRFRFVQPNGAVRAVEGASRAFYDDEGNLLRTVGAMIDVTEREGREAELRTREAQLRSVLETVPDAMVVIDEEGTIQQFSAAAEALWGYRAGDMLGRNFTMLAPADERDRYAAALARFLRSGARNGLGEVLAAAGETAEGRRFPVEVRAGIARTEETLLFTIFFRDISERLAAEERLSELSGELAHVSRQSAMSELAADLAHELNQPLSATSNFLAAARMLIEKGEDSGRVTDLLRMGSEQTQRAGLIIRRMRDFMARGEVDTQAESVERAIRDAVELVLVGTGQFHIRVNFELDPEAPLMHADRIQVQQVLVNLLRNAMDALRASPPAQRQIIIASRKLNEEMIEIQVSDSGPGIPDSVLKQLFSRFTTTKKNGGGMGIGLSISKRIIEAHGGTLSAENRPEGGASFRFTLPASGEGEGQ